MPAVSQRCIADGEVLRQCGLELVAKEARAVWGFAMFLGIFLGIVFLISMVGVVLMFLVHSVHQDAASSQTTEQAEVAVANTDAQREAMRHANDAWWDSAQPDGMKPVFFGKEYLVGPGGWTSIDVTSPASSGRFKYVVMFEGLDRFRARPNGEAEREYVYPNRAGFAALSDERMVPDAVGATVGRSGSSGAGEVCEDGERSGRDGVLAGIC